MWGRRNRRRSERKAGGHNLPRARNLLADGFFMHLLAAKLPLHHIPQVQNMLCSKRSRHSLLLQHIRLLPGSCRGWGWKGCSSLPVCSFGWQFQPPCISYSSCHLTIPQPAAGSAPHHVLQCETHTKLHTSSCMHQSLLSHPVALFCCASEDSLILALCASMQTNTKHAECTMQQEAKRSLCGAREGCSGCGRRKLLREADGLTGCTEHIEALAGTLLMCL